MVVGARTDGLIHISELKDGFVEEVESVVKVGDAVTARVKDVDVEKGRISLTLKSEQAASSHSDDDDFGGMVSGMDRRKSSATKKAMKNVRSRSLVS